MSTTYAAFLWDQSRSPDSMIAAVADNCRFDEWASDERWRQYEAVLSTLLGSSDRVHWADWTEANKLHVERFCRVPSYSVPDAFLPINRGAWYGYALPLENQHFVRLEAISRPLAMNALSLDDLQEMHVRANDGDADARRAMESFCETWNQSRDGRPMFAAFYDEVIEEAGADDWPIALRDRLGLGHHGLSGGRPLEVALMRYPSSDVLSSPHARTGHTWCAVPTVLDDGMHPFFFPAPRQSLCGATLHLDPDLSDTLTAEVLHPRIDYQAEHLLRLGRIDLGHQLGGDTLAEARDHHLLALRDEYDRDDFGELFDGRT